MKQNGHIIREYPLADSALPVKSIWFRGRLSKPVPLVCHHGLDCHFVKQGRGNYFINGSMYSFRRNSLILILPYEPHALIPQAAEMLEKGALIFLPSLVKPDFTRISRRLRRLKIRSLAVPESKTARFEVIFRNISDEINGGNAGWIRVTEAKLTELAILIRRLMEYPLHETRPRNPIVEGLVNHLEKHFRQPLTVADLACCFGYSYSYLSRIFTRHIGMGIKRFLIHRRILEARRLLEEEPELKITAIAEKCGFSDLACFNTYFRAMLKTSPGVYRKKAYLESKKTYIRRSCNY